MANLPNLTPRILDNTSKLIKLYNNNPKFRELFDKLLPNPRVTYKGQPLKLYLRIITSFSFKYRKYEKEVRGNPEKFKELLFLFYRDPREFGKFEKLVQSTVLGKYTPEYLNKEEAELAAKIEQTQDTKDKQKLISQLETKLDKTYSSSVKQEEKQEEERNQTNDVQPPQVKAETTKTLQTKPINQPIRPSFITRISNTASQFKNYSSALLSNKPFPGKPELPSFVKNISSLGKRLVIRFAPNIISGAALGAVGAQYFGPAGFISGFLGGSTILPMSLKSGALRGVIGGGGKAMLGLGARGAALAAGPVGIAITAAMSAPQIASIGKKIMIYGGATVIALILILMPGGLLQTNALLPPFGSIGEAATLPPGTSGGGLGYFIPFRDSTVKVLNPEAVRQQVLASWPNAKLANWDTIVSQSIASGWNPAFVLSLWIEETGAQGVSNYTDALGCDPSHPTTDINISLKCLFNNFKTYTNEKFADFMCVYGGDGFHSAPCTFNKENPNFPGNIKIWYSRLVPSGHGSITNLPETPPPPTDGNYQAWLKENFHIIMKDGFSSDVYKWAYEILNSTFDKAPKFKTLLLKGDCQTITLTPTTGISNVRNCTIPIKSDSGEVFFKYLLIHELGHIINTTSWKYNEEIIKARLIDGARSAYFKKGFLTYYSEHAASASDLICGPGDDNGNRTDEDFAESVAYFINDLIPEQNMNTKQCGVNGFTEPLGIIGLNSPSHYLLMQKLLK